MKNLIIRFIFGSLLIANSSLAQKHHHHSEKSHVHGSAKVSLAFEGTKGKLEFESPAESTVGFEHKARTEADQKKVAATLDLIKNKITEMVLFDPELKCVWKPLEVKINIENDSHSETHAEFDINCEKSPVASKIDFHFTKIFPKLKKVDVQVLVDDKQKSLQVKTGLSSLQLK